MVVKKWACWQGYNANPTANPLNQLTNQFVAASGR
jgi:hypothetical protein